MKEKMSYWVSAGILPEENYQGGFTMKKLFALILAVAMLLSVSSAGLAAVVDPDSPQQSNYFNAYGIVGSAPGSNKIVYTFSCAGVGVCSQLGVANYWVQKRNSSGEWVDVTEVLPGKCGYNVSTYAFSKNFYGIQNQYYRVKCTFVCVKDGSMESKSYTSPAVRCK